MKLTMLAPQAMLTLPNGSEVHVERIGRGRYTAAWRNSSKVYLQTSDKDQGKEIVCRLAGSPRNPHIPDCKRLDSYATGTWYIMPLYKPLTAKSGRAWEDFKWLRQTWEDARRAWGYSLRTVDEDVYGLNAKFLEMVEGSPFPSKALTEAVQQLLTECANYGTYTIEIVKRNCAVDDAGNLILLDAVFDLAEVRKKR